MKTRKVLVTGGNRGIGKAIVEGLSKMSGLSILLGSRDLEKGKAVANSIDGDITAVALDVSNRGGLKEQVADILEKHHAIDVLINNAGILHRGNVLEVSSDGFDETLRVNLMGPFDLVQLLAPGMIEHGYGRIVNVSSGWGCFAEGLQGPTAYAVSKAALNALTHSAAASFPDCVKINAMCPGWVRTDMGGQDAARSTQEGADTALYLATLPDDGPTGGFFRDRKPIAW